MYFFVDYENVGPTGFTGIENLTSDDKLFIFYNETNCKMPFSLHKKLTTTNATIEYFDTKKTGKNFLDFQLSTYLGYIIAKSPEKDFAIISQDQGFEIVMNFWNDKKINISLFNSLAKKEMHIKDQQLITILTQYPDDVKSISDIIEKYKTKQGINNALVKQFGGEKTSTIYKLIKPLIKDKK